MNRYVMEEFYDNPALRRRLYREAHHERSRAIGAGIAWLLGRPGWLLRAARKQLAQRLHASHWIARLG